MVLHHGVEVNCDDMTRHEYRNVTCSCLLPIAGDRYRSHFQARSVAYEGNPIVRVQRSPLSGLQNDHSGMHIFDSPSTAAGVAYPHRDFAFCQ